MKPNERTICRAVAGALAASGRRTADVADAVGLTRNQLTNISIGRTKPKAEIIDRLRRELHLGSDWPGLPLGNGVVSGLVSLSGTPLEEILLEGGETVSVPERLARLADFGWIVEGDLMAPFLQETDCAGFKREDSRRSGMVYLFNDSRYGNHVRVLLFDSGTWVRVSLNGAGREPLGEARIVGRLVGFSRIHGTTEQLTTDSEGLQPGPEHWLQRK